MGFRAFISVDIGRREELVEALGELRSTGASLKLVSPEVLHVTLKFLGNVKESAVPAIEEAMGEAVSGIPPLTVRLKGMGAFPSRSRIRVVWVGMEGADALAEIASRLEEGLEPLGFRRERRAFSPHLTLARVKDGRGMDRVRDVIDSYADREMGTVEVSGIRLKKSVLGPKGPTYSTVLEVELPG